jgi:MEMO1 family protein
MLRSPAVSGQFYEENKESLITQIEDSFLGAKGVGHLPKKTAHTENIIGAISPHAGYYFSGQAATFVYEKIAKCDVDTFVIIGVNHYGLGSKFSTTQNISWETPIGITQTDRQFITELIKKNKDVRDEPNAHSHEHSIEVQLPFLQYTMNSINKRFMIVPIMIKNGSFEELENLAKDIYSVSKAIKRKICVIASSDFTHYGSNYDYNIFDNVGEKDEIKKKVKEYDLSFIELIKKLDAKGFYEKSEKEEATICGRYPITLLLCYSKLCNPTQVKLESYYSSDDIMASFSKKTYNGVSYASIIIE